MATTVTIDLRHVARGLNVPLRQVQAVVELLDDGNTVPFITRYRKDQTGGLDEEQIRQIQARLAKMRLLAERKQTILRSIEAQDKLTEKLAKQIHAASTTKRLEDLYLPYKPKKQTLATLARSRGLEPLTREIIEADPACADLDARAADFANPDRQVPTAADALLGAGHILAEQLSERAELRQRLREILQRTGKLISTRIGGEPKDRTEKPAAAVPDSTQETAPQPADGSVEQPAKTPGTSDQVSEKPESPGDKPAEESKTPNNPGETAAEESEKPNNPGEALAEESKTPGDLGETAVEESKTPDNPGETPAEASDATDQQEAQPVPVEPSADRPSEPDAAVTAEPPSETAAETPAQPAAADPTPAPKVQTVPKRVPGKPRPGKPRPTKSSKRELKKKKAEEKRIKAFHDYFDYSEEIKKIPPHRVLAINRGERAKILRVKLECDLEAMHQALDELLVPPEHPHADYLRGCARDALARLILPALEREIRRELTDRAEAHAVSVFARNLRNLLLQPPVRDRRVLAVDPGFKSGCKLVALDQFGNVLEHGVIFLVGKPERRTLAQQEVIDLVNRFQLSLVVIGNGTACRETEDFFAELIAGELKDRGVAFVIVNEAGASVYSTSRTGREEFPNYDATLRGAISIGRRLQDPLSELVKIDAANIGVGLYQHDVKAKHLRASLDEVVESCVNYVGVDVNTASAALLRYVSGLNQLTARRVQEYRQQHGPFRNREQLREVPGLGETTFVQAAGFLKIAGGDNPLDATWIHPESYETATRVLSSLECSPADLAEREKVAAVAGRVRQVDLDAMAGPLAVGTLTLRDILAQLARPGRDPREDLPGPVFKQGVLKLEDLTQGMELTGTVLNVVDFGAFVDIGMHDSGLVHVSQLADKYIRDPHEVVAVGDVVKVWVMEVDKERRRVSLTMVQPGTQRPHHPRRGGKPDGEKGRSEGGGPADGPSRKDRQSRRPQSGESTGRRKPPRGKGPPRRRDQAKPKYRPKPRAKPVVPLTDEMKSGKKPMRTFGDLAQFFQHNDEEGGVEKKAKAPPDKKPQVAQDATPPPVDEPPGAEQTSQAAAGEPPSDAAPTVDEAPRAAEDQTQKAADPVPSAEPSAEPSADDQPANPETGPSAAEDPAQPAPDETENPQN